MSTKLNRDAYQKLVDENIAWLEKQPKTLERDHSIDIVRSSVRFHYDVDAQLAELAASEVQLRTELTNTRASIQSLIVEAKTPRGVSSHTVITFGGVMIGDIDRALAAPPSTAAAELVALRDMENAVQAFVKNATVDTWEMGWATLKAHVAAVAAAREGK